MDSVKMSSAWLVVFIKKLLLNMNSQLHIILYLPELIYLNKIIKDRSNQELGYWLILLY